MYAYKLYKVISKQNCWNKDIQNYLKKEQQNIEFEWLFSMLKLKYQLRKT